MSANLLGVSYLNVVHLQLGSTGYIIGTGYVSKIHIKYLTPMMLFTTIAFL